MTNTPMPMSPYGAADTLVGEREKEIEREEAKM
jgi:hypothetical protein